MRKGWPQVVVVLAILRAGAAYLPLDPDDNPHKTPDGGLRSLGAMTYGGLKSFLYAGVSKDERERILALNCAELYHLI